MGLNKYSRNRNNWYLNRGRALVVSFESLLFLSRSTMLLIQPRWPCWIQNGNQLLGHYSIDDVMANARNRCTQCMENKELHLLKYVLVIKSTVEIRVEVMDFSASSPSNCLRGGRLLACFCRYSILRGQLTSIERFLPVRLPYRIG